MNYSDYDSDGYLSNEDNDYVPSDNALSEDDVNELEKEDPLSDDGNVPHPEGARTKKTKKSILSIRKRKKGVLKLDKEGEDGGGGEGEAEEATLSQREVKSSRIGVDDEDGRKKKSDDLWASFLSDVGSRPKESTDTSQSSTTQKENASTAKDARLTTEKKKTSEAPKITITKVFDFAGEELRVNKEVLADSKEAKTYLRNQKQEESGDDKKEPSNGQPPLPSISGKRPVGMSSILGQMGGKKPKMSTLEKSKMDWEAFKSEEGISEELAIHNRGKEGFVERKNFLERVDHRQFELEKAVRLNNMKN